MALSRGQFTNVISKGNKMAQSYGKILNKKTKKELYPISNKDIEFLSQKRKLQMGLKDVMKKLKKPLGPASDKDIEFIKKSMKNIKLPKKKKKLKNPHQD